jgi:hypothetical protein
VDEVDGEQGRPVLHRELLGLVPLAFDFLPTHDLPAFRCLPPPAAATHLVRRADDDFLPVAREAPVLAANAETVALHNTRLTISKQIRTAGRRWARGINKTSLSLWAGAPRSGSAGSS